MTASNISHREAVEIIASNIDSSDALFIFADLADGASLGSGLMYVPTRHYRQETVSKLRNEIGNEAFIAALREVHPASYAEANDMADDEIKPAAPAAPAQSEKEKHTMGKFQNLRKNRAFIPAVAATAALLVGVGIGASVQPEPEVQVKEVPVEKEVVKTVTEYEVPASCKDSVEAGDKLVQQIADYLSAEAEAWDAASTFSASALDSAASKKQTEADALVSSVQNYLSYSGVCTSTGDQS